MDQGQSTAAPPPRLFARSAEDLIAQVAWFNRLRLGAVAGMVVLTAVAAHVLDAVVDERPLYLLAALTLAVDLVYMGWFRRLAPSRPRSVRRHVDVQIAIDLLILTAILHFSGGVTSPFVLFYLFHAFIAALLLSVRAALVVVAVSVALVTGLGLAERYGVLDHHPLHGGLMDLRTAPAWALWAWLGVFGVTMLLSVYFVGTVLHRLVRREEQLGQLDRQLAQSEKLASVGNLAAGVAHEINNPVGVIQSKVQILRHRIRDGDPAEALLGELDTVEKHARRISGITDGLLTFSREAPFALEPVPLDPLVAEAVELVALPYGSADVRLVTDLRARATVQGSANHLLQVLVNIMLNAADASPAGSEVRVRTGIEADEAVIEIEDQGEGIPPERLSKIFDPFFTTKDVGRGTGLGLAVSHGIVERHAGRIDVASTVGEGARFTVRLPLAERSTAQTSNA